MTEQLLEVCCFNTKVAHLDYLFDFSYCIKHSVDINVKILELEANLNNSGFMFFLNESYLK